MAGMMPNPGINATLQNLRGSVSGASSTDKTSSSGSYTGAAANIMGGASSSHPSAPPVAPAGPSGATAQTSGFVGGSPTSSARRDSAMLVGGTYIPDFITSFGAPGGGLASNPNVPRPGASLDPATGKPYAAGLTRAELEAKKAAAAASTGSEIDPSLSGREQAAKQLVGTGSAAVQPVGLPGTGPNATTSIYSDVTETLDKVGQKAYQLMPNSLKEVLSNSPTSPKVGSDPTVGGVAASPTGRRGSAAMFLDRLKEEGGKIVHDVQGALQGGQTVGGNPSQSGLKVAGGQPVSQGGLLQQVKDFVGELSSTSPAAPGSFIGASSHAIAPRTSLPSQEPAGAVPGEKTSGVGALPGTIAETGVAVLPDEKKVASSSGPAVNQGMLPGESTGAAPLPAPVPGSGPSVDPKADEVAPSTARQEKETTGGSLAGPATAAAGAATAAGAIAAASSADKSSSYSGLAPPLPQTFLGKGAAEGATDLETTPGVATTSGATTVAPSTDSSSPAAPLTDSLSPAAPSNDISSPAAATRGANERTDSLASVTAIRHGHEGDRSSGDDVHRPAEPVTGSPLAQNSITATSDSTTPAAVGTGASAGVLAAQGEHASTATSAPASESISTSSAAKDSGIGAAGTTSTAASSVAGATSLTPGHEHEGVGHPSTRDTPGTTREPGSYPAPDHSGKVHGEKAATTSTSNTSGASTPLGNGRSSVDGNGHSSASHRRTSSTASDGKKKVGFMHKLKGEMKVIGGKLSGDHEKVEEGQRIKHGEL